MTQPQDVVDVWQNDAAGVYSGFAVNGKGFSVLADPGTIIQSEILVSGSSAAQRVTLAGLDMRVTAAVGTMVEVPRMIPTMMEYRNRRRENARSS